MSKAREFEMTVADGSAAILVTLRGAISERAELDAARVAGGQPIQIDVGDVSAINSLGVHGWIRFLDALCSKSPMVVLQRMAPVLVFQASMIGTFLSRARVDSFFSPWYCTGCETSSAELQGVYDPIPRNVKCPRCQSIMEFDSDPDVYQTFQDMCQAIATPSQRASSQTPVA